MPVNTYNQILTKGPESALPVVEDGKLRFTTDTGRLFVDSSNNARTEITDFVKGLTESEIKSQLSPLASKVYIASDTGKLLIYNSTDDDWETVSRDAETVNGKTVAVNVPADAVFTDTKDAAHIDYSNTISGLNATKVQGAIDELKSEITDLGYSNVLQAAPNILAGDVELNALTNVGVYGNILYPSNLGHSPEPDNTNATFAKLIVSEIGLSTDKLVAQECHLMTTLGNMHIYTRYLSAGVSWSSWSRLTNIVKTVTETITTNENRWIIFPQGRIILDARLASENYDTIILTSDAIFGYLSRFHMSQNTMTPQYTIFEANTEYNVTYHYI